jgi:hypothetical protein
MRIDRRHVLKAGSALLVLQGWRLMPRAAPAGTQPLAYGQGFIYDQRFPQGRGQARAARRRGMWVQAFEGDVTDLWLNSLRPHWAAGRGAVTGLTSVSALFCLEQMACDERYRVVQKELLGEGPNAPVRWVIDRLGPSRSQSV